MNETLAIAFALPVTLCVVQVGRMAYLRLRMYAVVRCVEQLSDIIVAKDEPTNHSMRALRRRYPLGVLLDSVQFVAERVYGDALHRLAIVVEVCEIDHVMPGRMSILPAHPEKLMRYVARYATPLSLYEVAELVIYMRRTGTAIAYTPLLTSSNRNLQMVGIYLCHHFAIVDAEPHLQRLVTSADGEVLYLALHALCTIRGDISAPHVGVALARLLPHQRNAFVLRAVQCCYSLRSCAHHLSEAERNRFSQRVNSYKCRIVCN